ncbi:PREDICTED: EF-hand calcium-binding domain-containing protein 2 isoform X1 [Nicrophorus vespilloides]|uniref:EF-hand calcium-binding domain-containing protein 2 isoform X1 n=1 Tax=Nicrophorus vespilloides TaxID=110193 RepID=A0ABM1M6S2_NICVS|nr:PREDICTED: EF-hand calcium-binding domain-containing protein 2 isoform X1 [Nicrophorus vespilloides]
MDEDEEEIIVPINNDLEKKIAETFDIFDHSGMRTVDAREVGTIVRALGCCPTEAEVQELVLQMEDANNPGSIHLINFLPVIAKVISEHKFEPESPAKLLEAFHILDPDGHGYITKEHMSTIITQDGEPFTQDELDEMLEIAIDPHSQTIPYEYYINQLMVE